MNNHRRDVSTEKGRGILPKEKDVSEVADKGDEELCREIKPRKSLLVGPGSKFVILLAVIGSATLAITLFIYGFLITIFSITHSVSHFSGELQAMKEVMAYSIEIIDLFLVATVFYIIALGFFELFIAKAPLPGWLKICNLDDLKEKLLGLVVIALSVLFLGEALTWTGSADIMAYGLASSAVVISISLYFWAKR